MDTLPGNAFLEGPITLPLLKFTLPLALALILQALYGAVDMAVVGHLGTTADVAAVGIGSLIMQALTAVIAGLSMGVTVRLGHAVGAGDLDRAGRTVGASLLLTLLGTLLLTLPMIFLAPALVGLMSAPPPSFGIASDYVRICSSGLLFILAYNVIAGVFRGVGDSRSPPLFVAVSCGVNALADLYFVGGLGMGARGAACATVLSQGVGVAFSLLYIRRRKLGLPVMRGWGDGCFRELLLILKVGLPVASQDLLNYLSFMILVSIVNAMGLLAAAAIAVEGKLFAFFSLIPISFMSALSAFVAQNMGAGKPERAVRALQRGVAVALAVGCLTLSLALFCGEFLASLFTENPEAVRATARFLKGGCLEHLCLAVVFCMLGYFNGISRTLFVVIQGAVCAFLVRIPLAAWLSRSAGQDLIVMGWTLSFSAFVGLLQCVAYFFWCQNRRERGGCGEAPSPSP